MQLTVLGSGAACPPAGKNSSGILISEQERTILLDCGHGVASATLAIHPDFDIDDIFISHMHADHFIDVLALRFRVTRAMEGIAGTPPRTTLHLPPGGIDVLAKILNALTFPSDFCENTFNVREYDPGKTEWYGPIQVRFSPAEHYIPSWAIRIEGKTTVTYSGDTAPCDLIRDFARGSDRFICEATLKEPEYGLVRGHCTATQAAQMAEDSKVNKLLLTHFWYGTNLEEVRKEAASIYSGPLVIAEDGTHIEI